MRTAPDTGAPSSAAPSSIAIETITIDVNGQAFEVESCGTGDRLALCLHGFPEHAAMWRDYLPLLAALGYRAWAPNQRGYGASPKPSRIADYDLTRLMEDAAGLIDRSGARSVILIAHDWGAMVAWCFAIRRLRPLTALIVLNVPHPARYLRCLLRWQHLVRSLYVLGFVFPLLPDWLFRRRGGRLVRSLLRLTAHRPQTLSPVLLDIYCRNMASPGVATAALNWYRAGVFGGLLRQAWQGFPMIEIPTLIVWGDRDPVLSPILIEGMARYVAHLTVARRPDAAHWVAQEDPAGVAAAIGGFLQDLPPP
jgi:pimeloyl-ACP methyl ester carboxylesterase